MDAGGTTYGPQLIPEQGLEVTNRGSDPRGPSGPDASIEKIRLANI